MLRGHTKANLKIGEGIHTKRENAPMTIEGKVCRLSCVWLGRRLKMFWDLKMEFFRLIFFLNFKVRKVQIILGIKIFGKNITF